MDTFDSSEEQTGAPGWKKWVVIGVVVILLAAAVVVLYQRFRGGTVGGFEFLIRFDSADTLTEHSPLFLSGIEIGEVKDVGLEANTENVLITVRVKSEYADRLCLGTTFQKITVITDGQTSTGIEADVYLATSPAVQAGQIVDGAENQLDAYTQMAKQLGEDFLDDKTRLGEYRVSTQITAENVSRQFVLESGSWVPQELFFSGSLPEGEQWYRTQNTTDDARVITAEGKFANIEDATWNKSVATLTVERRLFWTNYTYEETFPQGAFLTALEPQWNAIQTVELTSFLVGCAAAPEACLQECITNPIACVAEVHKAATSLFNTAKNLLELGQGIPTSKLTVQFTVTMPGTVIKDATNAQGISGSDVFWVYSGSELDSGVTLVAVSRVVNTVAVLIVGLLMLLACLVIAIILIRRRRSEYDYDVSEE